MSPVRAKVRGRILVIEDDHSARLLLERTLTRAGHEVASAEDGEEGLALLEVRKFDGVLADKNLPGLDGLSVLRRARERHPSIFTVLLTAFPSRESRAAARELRVDGYVAKPFGLREILVVCDQALQRSRAQAAARAEAGQL